MRPRTRPLPLLSAAAAALALTALPGAPGAAPAPVRCGTVERLPHAVATPRPPRRVLRGGGLPKQTRDSFGGSYQVRESTNFAVKWEGGGVSEDDAAFALASLEDSWALYMGELGHTPPTGSEDFRINAYIAGPTDNPSIDFDGGYATVDNQGHAYLVVSRSLLDQARANLRHVLSHEFYHDVQLGREVFYDQSASWYWEATAEWASQELDPDLGDAYGFVGAFALRAELPVYYFGDPFAGELEGVHQYGASIFPRHLTDRFGDSTMVPLSWETAGPGDDPLDRLAAQRPEGTLADAYREFAPHLALLDFTARNHIQAWVDAYDGAYPGNRYALEVPPQGTGDWVTPGDRAPRALGANVIELAWPMTGAAQVEIEVDTAGSNGTPGQVSATAVLQTVSGTEYVPIEITGGAGSAVLPMLTDGYLVVSATADTRSFDEWFGYRLRV